MPDMISLEAAQQIVVDAVGPTSDERVPIERAAGRVLAAPAVSAIDLPPFTSSAMDGFAVRSDDATEGAQLQVVGESAAGNPAAVAVEPGTAVLISTGAVVPDGADAVVPLERATQSERALSVDSAASAGDHIRPRGTDVANAEVVLPEGTLVGPAQVGAMAAAGVTEVQCAKRPRVGILVTGSELRAPGTELAAGDLYESNGLMLAAQLTQAPDLRTSAPP